MLTITTHPIGDVTVLHLAGNLTADAAEASLRQAIDQLIDESRYKLVLNVNDVGYIDSTGLGVLVAKMVSLRHRGDDLRLVHVTPRTSRLMTLTNLADVFEMRASEDAAVQSYDS